MSTVLRRNRKATDADIIRLNSLGFSMTTIARMLDCHPSSISLRLTSLKIAPFDSRRAFMEELLRSFPEDMLEDIADHLVAGEQPKSIKEYVRDLIAQDVAARRTGAQTPHA